MAEVLVIDPSVLGGGVARPLTPLDRGLLDGVGSCDLPDACVRHGAPTTTTVGLLVPAGARRGRDPADARPYALGTSTLTVEPDDATPAKVRLPVRDWPVCATCLSARRRTSRVAGGLLVAGLALFVATLGLGLALGPAPVHLVLLALGLGLTVAAVVRVSRGAWHRVLGVELTADGSAVVVAHPAPAFVAAVDTA